MLSLCLASSSAIRATLHSSLLLEHWLSQGLEAGWHPPAGSFLYPGSVFPAVDIVFAHREYELQRSSLFVCVPIHASSPTLLSPVLQGPLQSAKTFPIAHKSMCLLT